MTGTRDELLEHEADGIREFDNALPRWWLYGFYVTVAFAVVYLVNYHGLSTPLVGKSTLAAEYTVDVQQAALVASRQPGRAAAGVIVLRTDARSLTRGNAIFHSQENACFSCHRPDLGGLIGPNLTDDYWLHGCAPADLVRDVTTGFPAKGMLPFGTSNHLSEDDVINVVSYIVSMRGSNPPAPKPTEPARDQVCR